MKTMVNSKSKWWSVVSLIISSYGSLMFICLGLIFIGGLPDWLNAVFRVISFNFIDGIYPLIIISSVGFIGLIVAIVGKKATENQWSSLKLNKISIIMAIACMSLSLLTLYYIAVVIQGNRT